MSPADLAVLLTRVAPDLEALSGPWAIFGSAALIMQGAPFDEAPDLDILTTAADAERLEAAWESWRALGYAPDADGPFRSRFARYAMPEGVVEVMGDLEVCEDGVWSPVVIDEVVQRPFAGRTWPLASVAAQMRILRRFGRPKDLEKLSRLMAWAGEGASEPHGQAAGINRLPTEGEEPMMDATGAQTEPQVTLQPVGSERREALTNLFQLYAHDFSEQWFDRPEGELDENGRLQEYGLMDNYWSEPDHEVMLIRRDGRIAGFVMVNRYSHSGLPLDHQIAEFFVARKHRRARIGKTAALAVIAARPGQWEIAVARRNEGAKPFWRGVAAAAAAPGSAVEELDKDDERWNGLILRFWVA